MALSPRHPAARLAAAAQPRDCSELARLRSDWDELADRVGASPFLRPGWIEAWWRAFGHGELELLARSRDGRLAALLPIVRHRRLVRSPTNWHTPQFGVLCASPPERTALLEQLFASGADMVSLGFLPDASGELDELRAAAEAARHRVIMRPLERSCFVAIDADWDAYECGLSHNLRRDVARCWRRMRELGRVVLDVREDASCLDEALAVEQSGWKGRRGLAIVSRPETACFYAELARWAEARGWLRLAFLRLDGRAVAVHFAFESGHVYLPLKGGFDPALRAFSPGKLLIHATLEWAFARRLRRYEFLGDADEYKRRWATGTYDRMLFQAFAPTPAGLTYGAAYTYARPLAKRALAYASRSRRTRGVQ